MITPATHKLTLPGAMLQRGFWLYVWRIESPQGEYLYVGRTGDSSSANAAAPYTRIGQHLGSNKRQNALHRKLQEAGIEPESCLSFELIAHGPLDAQAEGMDAHKLIRDKVAPMEKALAEGLCAAGYRVLNKVHCLKPLDETMFKPVLVAFTAEFPLLR